MSQKTGAVIIVSLLAAASLSVSAQTATAAAPQVPRIVAQVALKDQTSAIAETTLFTPTSSGVFRISMYAMPTAPISCPNSASIYSNGHFTDDVGLKGWDGVASDITSVYAWGQSSVILRAAGQSPVTYSTGISDGGCDISNLKYDLFITVERLSN